MATPTTHQNPPFKRPPRQPGMWAYVLVVLAGGVGSLVVFAWQAGEPTWLVGAPVWCGMLAGLYGAVRVLVRPKPKAVRQ